MTLGVAYYTSPELCERIPDMLREEMVPAAFGQQADSVFITGDTADTIDFTTAPPTVTGVKVMFDKFGCR